AAEALHLAAAADVPQADGLVVAAGDETFAVGGEGEALDGAGVPGEAADFLAAHVVKADSEAGGRGDVVAAGTEGDAADFLGVLGEPAQDLTGLGAPVDERAVLAAGGEMPAVRRETNAQDGVGVAEQA